MTPQSPQVASHLLCLLFSPLDCTRRSKGSSFFLFHPPPHPTHLSSHQPSLTSHVTRVAPALWKGLVVGAGGTPKQKQQWRARSSVPQYERRSRPPGRVSDPALSSPERHVWLPDSLNSPGFGFSASPILLRAENRPVLAQTRVSTLSSLSSSPSWSPPHLLFSVSSVSFPEVKSNKPSFHSSPSTGRRPTNASYVVKSPPRDHGASAPESPSIQTLFPFGADSINDDSGQGGKSDPAEISAREI